MEQPLEQPVTQVVWKEKKNTLYKYSYDESIPYQF